MQNEPQYAQQPPKIVLYQPRDVLQHFANEKPGWKLAALFVERLPAVLIGLIFLIGLIVRLVYW